MNPSRRRVLAALAVAGGAGALTGSGTSALLGDESRHSGTLTTGIVDVIGEYWLASGPGSDGGFDDDPDGVVDGPRVRIPIGPLDGENSSGSVLLRFALPQRYDAVNNPVGLWLRTACPPENSLAEYLQVRVSYAAEDGTSGESIAAGSLREVADTLRTGYRIQPTDDPTGEGCLTDERYLLVEYDAGTYVGTETTELPLFVAAVQCRNGDPTASPFSSAEIDGECGGGFDCDCCWAIGKVEVEGQFQPDTTYQFDEGLADYGLAVTGVDGDTGVAFELVGPEDTTVPPLCAVQVKGGPGDERYARGDEFGVDTAVLSGTSDGLVYAPENPNNGKRHAISYVLVKVCAPELADGSCPQDVAHPASSVDSPGPPHGSSGPRGGMDR